MRAFLDANVLVRARVRDLVLTLAAEGEFTVHWSAPVLGEMCDNLPESMSSDQVAALLAALARAFPEAVCADELLSAQVVPSSINRKDRHVVAGALSADADVLVTDDRSLRAQIAGTSPLGLSVMSVDEFLAAVLAQASPETGVPMRFMARNRWRVISETDPDLGAWFVAWLRRERLPHAADVVQRRW